MRFSAILASLVAPAVVAAASNFAGSNLYYAAGINATARTTLLKGLQSANMKVLCVWIGAQSGNQKGTQVTPFPDVEPSKICNGDASCYDPTVLNLLDDFMVDAHNYGIKLLITMHSFNALAAGDVYGKQYGTGYFYEQSAPQQAFDKRLQYILNHEHKTLGKPWKQLSEYIFGFEAENEAMIGKGEAYIQAHTAWQCDRATTIKNTLGSNSGILVLTGGESWVSESVQSPWLSCAALDVISLHAYGVGDFATANLQTYVTEAKNAGKKMIMEEWGACYFSTENNNCPQGSVLSTSTRNSNIKTWAAQINAAGLSWLYWQVLPNNDPHEGSDYEIGIGDASWSTLQTAAKAAYSTTGAFDFSAYLL
ncbi:glycoside hydrolase [Lentinus tigrinus ALCF2SS1-7]|uniref:mannan endo-1,4-beta-mannosidase n=1 Tax=Lentinus tigrinus ALCF2SS1-6 TaxID=1328759 RepID=A0A5C2S4J7_9APHY|nr:glycoside hydrolase [Lentinus tigrinus ALCF2SS1-6]RPD72778.1 glycoside hydrolase [Lentinus tigrinus ALCF2SS1-7]